VIHSADRLRLGVALLILGSSVLCVGSVLFCRWKNDILPTDVDDLLVRIAEVYAVPVGLMCGATLAKRRHNQKDGPIDAMMWIATSIACAWVMIVMGAFGIFLFSEQIHVLELSTYCSSVLAKWSFLITLALGYMFGRSKG